MLGLMKNWLRPRANPIGVDFGSDSLKLAQVSLVDKELRLTAAACADVPSHVRHDPTARMNFFIQTMRELLAQGGFVGNSAVLAMPISSMFIQHLRLPRMDDEATKKAIPWEARGKLPIDPSQALIRHLIAGEVYHEQEAKNEVILMAAGREMVNHFLATASKAKLDVVGMEVEPKVIVDCFTHVYRRKADGEQTSLFVDLGCSGTRAVIARAGHILFARVIPVGGDHLTRAVATSLSMTLDEAKLLRLQLCGLPSAAPPAPQAPEPRAAEAPPEGLAILGAAMAAAQRDEADRRQPPVPGSLAPASPTSALEGVPSELLEKIPLVEAACREPIRKLVEELDFCRRYYEATFQNRPVDRLIFVGGEARHRGLCQSIAMEMSLPAQVGDPMVRMGRTCQVSIDSGIDSRHPQPNWTVAIGLTLGPAAARQKATEAA